MNYSFRVSEHDYGSISPIDGFLLRLQAIWYSIILAMSLLFNGFILAIVCTKKELQGYKNYFMITFTLVNLIGSALELPLMIISHFHKRFAFFDQNILNQNSRVKTIEIK